MDYVQNAFNETNASFLISSDRQLILELRSIIHPIRYIQHVVQAMHKYTNVKLYILLMNAYFTVLDDSKPLKIYDPAVHKTTGTGQPSNTDDLLEDE